MRIHTVVQISATLRTGSLGRSFAMKEHERLAEAERHLRRTAMDVLEVLRKEAGFREEDRAEFHIGLMQLPSRDKVGLVDIRFDSPARKTVCCVSLPTAGHFSAIPHGF